jgi:hypothetical protein
MRIKKSWIAVVVSMFAAVASAAIVVQETFTYADGERD